MARTFIRDFADGESIDEIFLVREKQVRTNRNGSAYLQLDLDDRSGSISARYWNVTENEIAQFDPGDFLNVKGKVQNFQGQLQLIIHSFQKCDPSRLNPAEFMPSTERDIEILTSELREHLTGIQNPALAAISKAFLMDEDFVYRFQRVPAGVRHHHAYLGGLLEHVVTLLKIVDRIADLYPDLDSELLKMGVFLHDVGKIRELSFERSFAYTDQGQLIGHLILGIEMLNDKLPLAEELLGEPLPEELLLRLKHLIASHHGTYEFGSPKLPMTPEAIALHHLDNLDAKVHNFTRTISEDMNPEATWTPYDQSISRRLFKGSAKTRSAKSSRNSNGPRS